LATSRSIAALVAQPSFPNGTGIVGRLALLDGAESGSLARSAVWATMQRFASALRRASARLIRQSSWRRSALDDAGIAYVPSGTLGLGEYMRRIGRNSVGWGLEADAA
jgi:hypothetical protein